MSEFVVLDTDVWSSLYLRPRRGEVERAAQWRSAVVGRSIVIATQTWGELLYGAQELGPKRRADLQRQLDATAIIPVTEEVVEAFARMRADCRRMGHALHDKVHMGDLWIAATAIALGVPLLSGDGVYRGAPGLTLL